MSIIYIFKQLYIDPLAITNRYTQLSIVTLRSQEQEISTINRCPNLSWLCQKRWL